MKKYFLPGLSWWLLRGLIISLGISFIIAYFSFKFFLDRPISDFALVLFGFGISFFVLLILFVRMIHPLFRVVQRLKHLAEEKSEIDKNEDYFLSEPGEFYEINKSINSISDDLQLKKTIISKESSELEAVISAVSGAILAIDKNKKVLFFNNQAINLFAPDKHINKSQEIYLSEIIRDPQILDMYTECLKTSKVIKKTLAIGDTFSMEQEVVYEITVAPFEEFGDKKEARGAVALFYNVTNIKKTERIQTDFISNVSHELRTPLTAIQGYVQTLLTGLDTSPKEKTKQFLEVINRNVERLVSLLNHFLELSIIEDKTSLTKEEISTEDITNSIIEDLHVKNRKIECNFSAKKVKADRHLLKQVLYNLLDNALKYTAKDCLIEVLWTKNEVGDVVLTVKDHGKGIPISEQDRMFERFYRADPSRKTKGTGLGLSIVKQLITKHGGNIKLVSDGRKGSSFICIFPE